MKKATIQLLMMLSLAIILIQSSCSKDKSVKMGLDEKNLTPCLENSVCTYLFSERADVVDDGFTLKSGAYRLFWSEVKNLGVTTRIYVKAPMEGETFMLDKTAILAGRVKLARACPTCFSIPFKLIVDGYVKGVNLTPGQPADKTKWLLEIKLFLENEPEPLILKQYFYPNFVFN